ncbi:ABC transporter ATP-binding protein, partial [Mycobacterium tuberculosis]|nr:ABC transporter ATP-binding protein [Mycobacterium tuberculosis]
MSDLSLSHLGRSYGKVEIIPDLDLEVKDGEFVVLVGPSGCGKSTLLRLIAGLDKPTRGTVTLDGRDVTQVPAAERGLAMVFQSYALYPHMTVAGNIAFPLIMDAFRPWYHLPIVNSIMRRRLMRSPAIAGRTEAIARQLELDTLMHRRPAGLSGGQRQRVALARALVRDPALYLLDEPLSNLDAKLRNQMRAEIKRLHARLGTTVIYVTHDQVEAMTLADRIVVMRDGHIEQIGTPTEVFDAPANAFVASFIGSPPMNLVPATVAAGDAGPMLSFG